MKLRNKRTGDIWEFDGGFSMKASQETSEKAGASSGSLTCFADSLSELNEEWEDYEDPKDKGYWYIDDLCRMRYSSELLDEIDDRPNNWMIRKLCGNYFETREEAEKAVEKLKAWKRLKDKGFRFTGIMDEYTNAGTPYNIQPLRTERNIGFNKSEDLEWIKDNRADLDLLFGGEE